MTDSQTNLLRPTPKTENTILINNIDKLKDIEVDVKEEKEEEVMSSESESEVEDEVQQPIKIEPLTKQESTVSVKNKYNVINENIRKIVIQKITMDNQNIKDVAREHGLKLSTCKAILNVYLKEGRIGKKTQRDRKFKIVNTLICTTLNPLNPLQSTVTPYVSITETKTSKNKTTENQNEMVKQAIKQASEHLQNVFSSNSSEIFGIKVPQTQQNQLQQTFMQAQMQSFNQMLLKNSTGQQQQQQPQAQGFANFNNLQQAFQLNQATQSFMPPQSPSNNQGFLQHLGNNVSIPSIIQSPPQQKLSLDKLSQFQLSGDKQKQEQKQQEQLSNLDLKGIENIQKKLFIEGKDDNNIYTKVTHLLQQVKQNDLF